MTSRWDRKGGVEKTSHAIMAVVAGLLAVCIIGFFFYKAHTGKAGHIDKTTFCRENIDSVTAVLIDATDELSVVQRTAIRNRIGQVKEGLPKYGRIDLYAIGEENQGMPRTLFSMCNPGTGADADAISENARLMKKKWTKEFSEKLDREIDRVMAAKAAAQSPIMEAIQAIALQSFGNTQTVRAEEKRLILVSDMIQHSTALSQFKGVAAGSFEKFAKTDGYRKVRADLTGVNVEIFYLHRTVAKNIQTPEHLTFWEQFIRDSAGRLTRFLPIEG